VTGTDTVTTIAAGLAALINGDTNLSNIGVTANYNAPATMSWSKEFKANQQVPGWNTTVMSATDAASNTATAPYGIYTISPVAANPNYDLNGNMTSDGTNAYKYDAENRLVEIDYPGSGNYSSFTYDGLGRNVSIVETSGGSSTSTILFVWSATDRTEGRESSGTIKRFFALGQMNNSSSFFYTPDVLGLSRLVLNAFPHGSTLRRAASVFNPVPRAGSVRDVTDASENIQDQYEYSPFGQVIKLTEAVPSDIGYAGYYVHMRSALNLTMFRPFNPSLARWQSRDPFGELAGTNLYEYVNQSPITSNDPLGLDAPCDPNMDPELNFDRNIGAITDVIDLFPPIQWSNAMRRVDQMMAPARKGTYSNCPIPHGIPGNTKPLPDPGTMFPVPQYNYPYSPPLEFGDPRLIPGMTRIV
jgi:RHS repeat-associated protein